VTTPVEDLLVSPSDSLRDCVAAIDRGGEGIALAIDEEGKLAATITDGDVRRALLAGADLADTIEEIVRTRANKPGHIVAPFGTPDAELVRIMNEQAIRHIPLLDEEGRVAGIALMSQLVEELELPLRALIMAGGSGTRLRPLTEQTPKPMLPVGSRPLLEHVIGQLRDAGIRHVKMATHYKEDVIREHFGDGSRFGVEVEYVSEDRPLGTAGALSLVEDTDEPILVVNGDILSRLDFRAMLRFHEEHDADMTVAVRPREYAVPYGIIEVDDIAISRISEKPSIRFLVNAGIYLLSPRVPGLVPGGEPSDMPDLISRLIGDGLRVVAFPVHEYWIDIGEAETYAQAKQDTEGGEFLGHH
jgi:dTDP-glucose pyrophosphorylase/CBS domain-containing protein